MILTVQQSILWIFSSSPILAIFSAILPHFGLFVTFQQSVKVNVTAFRYSPMIRCRFVLLLERMRGSREAGEGTTGHQAGRGVADGQGKELCAAGRGIVSAVRHRLLSVQHGHFHADSVAALGHRADAGE